MANMRKNRLYLIWRMQPSSETFIVTTTKHSCVFESCVGMEV